MRTKRKRTAPASRIPAGKSGHRRKTTLTIMNGCFEGLEIPLDKPRIILGRELGCNICLDDSHVSDLHAAVIKNGGDFSIEDLGSGNGTYVNGERVQKCRLRDGDSISIGGFELRFGR